MYGNNQHQSEAGTNRGDYLVTQNREESGVLPKQMERAGDIGRIIRDDRSGNLSDRVTALIGGHPFACECPVEYFQ